jgi:NADPH:quinone reductase-like Zn-dependent oxidoreductase
VRAAVLHGPGQAPEYREHPDPVQEAGATVVRMTAATIVPLDQLIASGTSYWGRPPVPYVPGDQGVGVVERSAVLPEGARVFVETRAGRTARDGSLAERCAVPDDDVVPLPDGVPETLAAALGMSGVAAWMALTERARVQPGERVIVLGAGGTVGQLAVGLARLLGAGRVIGVCRSEAAEARAIAAGADEVVLLSDDVDALAARLQQAVGGATDVVVDTIFGVAATAACRVLAPFGRLVNIGGLAGDTAEFSSAVLRSRSASVLGYTNALLTADQRRAALDAVFAHAAAGRLHLAHEVLPLAEAADAWRRQASGEAGVRLVLTP